MVKKNCAELFRKHKPAWWKVFVLMMGSIKYVPDDKNEEPRYKYYSPKKKLIRNTILQLPV